MITQPQIASQNEGSEDSISNPLWTWPDLIFVSLASLMLFVLILTVGAVGSGVGVSADLLVDFIQGTPTLDLSIWLLAASGFSLVLGVGLVAILRSRFQRLAVEFSAPSVAWSVGALVLGLLAIPLSSLIVLGVQMILGQPPENVQLEMILPEGFSLVGMVAMLFLGGLLVPVGEELLFRAVLYRWLRDRWGITAGILISSIVFGLFHGEISLAVGAGVLGLLLAWSYQRSGSLWVPIAIHAINNGFKIGLLYLLAYLGVPLE